MCGPTSTPLTHGVTLLVSEFGMKNDPTVLASLALAVVQHGQVHPGVQLACTGQSLGRAYGLNVPARQVSSLHDS